MVLTSKHHDGYALWPSKYSFSWNSMDVGPHRDLIDELSSAIRTNTTIKFGLYHSYFEWFNPMYLSDKQKLYTENDFVTKKVSTSTADELFSIYSGRWKYTSFFFIKYHNGIYNFNEELKHILKRSHFFVCCLFRYCPK